LEGNCRGNSPGPITGKVDMGSKEALGRAQKQLQLRSSNSREANKLLLYVLLNSVQLLQPRD